MYIGHCTYRISIILYTLYNIPYEIYAILCKFRQGSLCREQEAY